MAGFSLTNIISELETLASEAPDVLANLPAMLDKFVTLTAPEVAVLAKWIPSLATMDATMVADLKVIVSLFSTWGPTLLPFVVKFLVFVGGVLSPAPVAGQMQASAPVVPGTIIPGGVYPL